jgi:hypothetical protein
MIRNTPILCPERLRHVPRQFSWIDHRLVRDRHIRGPSACALSLYLFLCTVADARGMSYYSDGSAGALLQLSAGQLRDARGELMQAGLIAYRRPFYQVLSLEPLAPSVSLLPAAPHPREGGVRPVVEILHSLLGKKRDEEGHR